MAETPPAAILAAGGIGERARTEPSETPKQFRPLAGRPVIAWSLDALRAAGCEPLVVVLPERWMDEGRALLNDSTLVYAIGGATRQESIGNGLDVVDSPQVVVQDASRPLVTPALIRSVIGALGKADAAIAAVPMDETLKRGEADRVLETIDRSAVWKAQTPAAFVTALLKQAHEAARKEGFVGTDEAQLVERRGGTVVMVPGSRRNLKITWSEDFELAEALMQVQP